MRTIGSGGEALGEELLEWGKEVMGLTINEFYGQTEVNLVVGSCCEVMEIKPGSMGRAIPGHEVAVVDDAGNPVLTDTVGEVAIKRPDPVMCLEYWKNPEATRLGRSMWESGGSQETWQSRTRMDIFGSWAERTI
jgi:acetyl-CoA synthetase